MPAEKAGLFLSCGTGLAGGSEESGHDSQATPTYFHHVWSLFLEIVVLSMASCQPALVYSRLKETLIMSWTYIT